MNTFGFVCVNNTRFFIFHVNDLITILANFLERYAAEIDIVSHSILNR